MQPERPFPAASPHADGRAPVFGSWPRLYAAVVLAELLTLALIALFSSHPY